MSKPNFKLKELRSLENISQRDMAKILKLSYTTYNRKENGISDFTESEIIRICIIFNMNPEAIFFTQLVAKQEQNISKGVKDS